MPDSWHISHICLRVSDLDESVAFYRDVVRFEPTATLGSSDRTARLVPPGDAEHGGCAIVLMSGRLFQRAPAHGHIIIEFDDADEIEHVYRRAVHWQARATRPRDMNGMRQSCIFDPNGHKVEVIAPTHHEHVPSPSRDAGALPHGR